MGSGKHLKKEDRKCKVCSGSGLLSNQFFKESKTMIKQIIEREMQSKIEETIRQSFMQQSMMQSQPSQERHEGVKCTNCGVDPIIGHRFMCPQNPNYNLCQICEEQVDYPHALLKVKVSKQAKDYLDFSLSQS